jgi:hypothetical protein
MASSSIRPKAPGRFGQLHIALLGCGLDFQDQMKVLDAAAQRIVKEK